MVWPLMSNKKVSKHYLSPILNFKSLLLISNRGNCESCSSDEYLSFVCLIVSFIL